MGDYLATIDMGRKLGGCAPFGRGELGPHVAQCGLGRDLPSYQVASWSIQPFGHNTHGPKIGGVHPFWGGGAGSPSNTMSLGLRPTSTPSGILIYRAIWPQQVWVENWGLLCPFGGGGPGSLSNTMWPAHRPTCIPSFILIRPTIWPQYTNVTDRTDRQWSDSIRRTVLQTVAQPFYKRLPNKCNVEINVILKPVVPVAPKPPKPVLPVPDCWPNSPVVGAPKPVGFAPKSPVWNRHKRKTQ